jgi:hypothetical protein
MHVIIIEIFCSLTYNCTLTYSTYSVCSILKEYSLALFAFTFIRFFYDHHCHCNVHYLANNTTNAQM